MPGADRGDQAVAGHGDFRVEKSALVTVAAGQQVLGAGFRPLHAPPARLARRQRGEGHVEVVPDLVAEAAAYIEGANAHLLAAQAQGRGEKLLREAREGVVAEKLHHAVPGPFRHARAGFQWRAGETVKVQRPDANHVIGIGKGLVYVPVVEYALPGAIGPRRFMQHYGICQRGLYVHHRRKRLVAHVDQLTAVRRDGGCLCNDGDDRFTLVAHPVHGHRVVLDIGRRWRRNLHVRFAEVGHLAAGQGADDTR